MSYDWSANTEPRRAKASPVYLRMSETTRLGVEMSEVKPRPTITSYGAVPTGLNERINRIDMYRTKRKRWQVWKPKYEIHTLALCDDGVYEIFPPDHKPHPPLFAHTNQDTKKEGKE